MLEEERSFHATFAGCDGQCVDVAFTTVEVYVPCRPQTGHVHWSISVLNCFLPGPFNLRVAIGSLSALLRCRGYWFSEGK
jgi:hypothetical protein